MTSASLVGFVLGFVGVVGLVGWESVATASGCWLAVGACLLASLTYVIAAPYAKQILSGISSLAVMTGSQLGAALFLVPAIPFTVPRELLSMGIPLNVLMSIIAFSLMMHMMPMEQSLLVMLWVQVFAFGRDTKQVRMYEIMTEPCVVLNPNLMIEYAARLLTQHNMAILSPSVISH
ncbi:hypothetical protein [cf. Phormidesmis sp. LEGE 11477]|uniref:hypothetical protein n=1 Tax=cf. Phormidesmis sp. LEGE 11477 TaxID=1828680 RepID=UPI00187FADF2|nr:hypothetical protein [cf. Phormidesmis sp. LEGE 11477]MBE9060404.1 hypothetical protein [cf. Phormidesmis sp. LEGE 11477]